jgi:glycine/D-amino acid oxidase-like deaminating enzyme
MKRKKAHSMAPRVDKVHSEDKPPASTNVVIIGGGIIGTSAAFFLAQKGIPTVLCEKGHIAGEQSSRNWGWCRKMGRDPRELPLAIEALRLWGEMNRLTESETGFRRSGIMYLCDTQEEMDHYAPWMDHARDYQLDTKFLTSAEVAELTPGASRSWAGALYTASDGRGEPQTGAPAIAGAARRSGATILQRCAVRGIETAGGRISGVITEKGRIACQSVVLAGGAWSRLFCGSLGIELPQLKVLGSVMRTEKLDGGPETSMTGKGFGFRKRLDGGYNVSNRGANIFDVVPDAFRLMKDFAPLRAIQSKGTTIRLGRRFFTEYATPRRWHMDEESPFEQVRTLDPKPSAAVLDAARANIKQAFPMFKDMVVAESWGGYIDVTPDAIPVISGVDDLPGFFIATGFSGHGFGIGPGAGRLVAEMVTGEPTVVDPTPFRLSRFAEGAGRSPYPLAL